MPMVKLIAVSGIVLVSAALAIGQALSFMISHGGGHRTLASKYFVVDLRRACRRP